MGGDRQNSIQQGQQAVSPGPVGGSIIQKPLEVEGAKNTSLNPLTPGNQNIRFHENAGEVHFHVDDQNLKAAVPVAEWSVAWNALKNLRKTDFSYVDRNNGTHLVVKVGDLNGKLDCSIRVEKIFDGIGTNFDALDKFTNH